MSGKIKDPEASKLFAKEAVNVLLTYGPTIHACKACNYPVADGYCCTYCGTGDPGSPEDTFVWSGP